MWTARGGRRRGENRGDGSTIRGIPDRKEVMRIRNLVSGVGIINTIKKRGVDGKKNRQQKR